MESSIFFFFSFLPSPEEPPSESTKENADISSKSSGWLPVASWRGIAPNPRGTRVPSFSSSPIFNEMSLTTRQTNQYSPLCISSRVRSLNSILLFSLSTILSSSAPYFTCSTIEMGITISSESVIPIFRSKREKLKTRGEIEPTLKDIKNAARQRQEWSMNLTADAFSTGEYWKKGTSFPVLRSFLGGAATGAFSSATGVGEGERGVLEVG
mmetsp:Transcript_20211/g.31624  ORF Transcript_20211/g.31624 Transcript_20211/m.31624 type:complete len:211 (+) Transcript_20211:1719-2351(+)